MERQTPSPAGAEVGIAYSIKLKGHLEAHWADWMGGLNITHDGQGNSLLTGFVPDQATLHGILAQIRDLGLTLISITPQVLIVEEEDGTMKTPTKTMNAGHYAGFGKRLKAFTFDYLLISGYIVLLAAVTMAVIKISEILGLTLHWPQSPLLADLMAFVTLILPVILYFTLQEGSPKQATWGKRKAGIRVVSGDGGTLSRRQALVRSLVKMIPWQIGHTCLFHIPGWPFAVTAIPPVVMAGYVLLYGLVGIYIASALISKKRRTPYDWASGSYVIVEK